MVQALRALYRSQRRCVDLNACYVRGHNSRTYPEFLREEYLELGERWYAQEYLCAFVEAIGQVFSDDALDRAFNYDVAPLFGDDEAGDMDAFPPLFGGGSDALLSRA